MTSLARDREYYNCDGSNDCESCDHCKDCDDSDCYLCSDDSCYHNPYHDDDD